MVIHIIYTGFKQRKLYVMLVLLLMNRSMEDIFYKLVVLKIVERVVSIMILDLMIVILVMVFSNGCGLLIDLWIVLDMWCSVMCGRLSLFM